MKDWLKEWYNRYAILMLCVVIGFCGYNWVCWSSVEGQTWAAWIQAIGAVAALGVAIWIMSEQQRSAERQARSEAKMKEERILRSIRTEIEVLFSGFNQTLPEAIANAKNGRNLSSIYYSPEQPFMVGESLAKDFIFVSDDELRQLIIETYAKFKGILAILSMNNDLLREMAFIDSNWADNTIYGLRARKGVCEGNLKASAQQFRIKYEEAAACVTKITERFPSPNSVHSSNT